MIILADEDNVAERLISTLVSKMELMDTTITSLKAENALIKNHIQNPEGLLKKMGFIRAATPFTEDVIPDVFRGGPDDILKGEEVNGFVPQSNEEFHSMNWEQIHELASQVDNR